MGNKLVLQLCWGSEYSRVSEDTLESLTVLKFDFEMNAFCIKVGISLRCPEAESYDLKICLGIRQTKG